MTFLCEIQKDSLFESNSSDTKVKLTIPCITNDFLFVVNCMLISAGFSEILNLESFALA